MTKHTKPLSPATIRELNKRPDDCNDEYANVWRTVEQLPENKTSRRAGCIVITIMTIAIVSGVLSLMMHYGVIR